MSARERIMTARLRRWSSRCLAAALALVPAGALGQDTAHGDRCNPVPQIDVVHGDNAGADFASKFLTGCDVADASSTGLVPPPCRSTALHAPPSLAGSHLHLPPKTTCPGDQCPPFFWDRRYTSPQGIKGQDDDAVSGLEQAAVLFFAGHSVNLSPQAFESQPVPLGQMSLGDGCTRYFWLASCRVMAHGPLLPASPTTTDYIAPEQFDPSDGSQENVFRRWGSISYLTGSPPLNPLLRMACGGSSTIGGGPNPTADIWRYLLVERLPPAESFLLGMLEPTYPATPLCIAHGGSLPWLSPIFDATFSTAPASPPATYLWIEYPVPRPEVLEQVGRRFRRWFRLEGEPAGAPEPPGPSMPVLAVQPQPEPAWLQRLDDRQAEVAHRSFGFQGHRLVDGGGSLLGGIVQRAEVCVERQPASGALVLSWRPRRRPRFNPRRLLSDDLLRDLVPLLVPGDRVAPAPGEPSLGTASARVVDLQLDAVPTVRLADLRQEDISHADGCRFVFLRPRVKIAGREIPLLGAGSQWLWEACPPSRLTGEDLAPESVNPCRRTTPALLTVSVLARPIQSDAVQELDVFTLDEARRMAPGLFPRGIRATDYQEVRYRWGYKAAPAQCRQERQYLIYEFDFQPRAGASPGLGPLTVEVPAHKLCEVTDPKACFAAIEEAWDCSAESAGL